MDFVTPAILFAIGFGGALLARKLFSSMGLGRRSGDLPMEKGSVRLDRVGRKKRKKGSRS